MAAFNTPAIPLPSVVVVPNNETVGGTLAVTGNETVGGTLGVTGAVLFSSNLGVSGTLGANGATSLLSTLNVTGATALASTLAVTGVTTVAAGSAAAPSVVSVTGTADTGVFFPSPKIVAVSTYGTERLRIDSTGNVGIGTTLLVAPLDVKTADTGVGTKTIVGVFGRTGAATTTTERAAGVVFSDANNLTLTAGVAGIRPNSLTNYNGELGLYTSNVGAGSPASTLSGLTEQMRITSAGNVGIGTASPGQKLDVSGGHITVRHGYANYSQSSGGFLIPAPYTDTGNNMWCGSDEPANVNSLTLGSGQAMLFSVNLAERMRISTAGLVGIGTTGAVYQLQLSTNSAGKPSSNTWTIVSDRRIKTDIVAADLDRCYDIVKSVPLKHFGYKPGVYTDGQIHDKHTLGWIAQDVQQVFSKAVSEKPFTIHTPQADGTVQDEVIEDCLDLDSSQMIAALYGCVQALMAKVEALEARG